SDDQALLVGKGQLDARGESDDGPAENGRTDDRVEDDVRLRPHDQLADPRVAVEDFALPSGAPGRVRGAGLGERDRPDPGRLGLADEPFPTASGAEPADA